jgi:hypothetical protein
MVPFLYLLLAFPELSGVVVPPADQAVVAHATSLFVIVPTAVAGLLALHKSNLMAWRVGLRLFLGNLRAVTSQGPGRIGAFPRPRVERPFPWWRGPMSRSPLTPRTTSDIAGEGSIHGVERRGNPYDGNRLWRAAIRRRLGGMAPFFHGGPGW